MTDLIRCLGCGALVPDIEGSTHKYMLSAPGCWSLFNEVAVLQYEIASFDLRRMAVDAYAVQHPGPTDRRAIQSVAVHLISLYFVLERGLKPSEATDKMRRALTDKSRFVWLEPPPSLGDITVVDVVNLKTPAEHEALINRWARSAWEAWSTHHAQIRQWAK
ncbi:MAG: hypothetical protein HGB05_11950 [Chloroflexi bacterium]|nr:hypothetical protein [Chloroflexota bacterium]